jgi:hypothetical protein
LTQPIDALTRFQKLTAGEYKTSSTNQLLTITRSKQILMSSTGTQSHLSKLQVEGHTPEQGMKEFKEIILQTAGLGRIKEDLVNGEGNIFAIVAVPELAERILKEIQFQEMSEERQSRVVRKFIDSVNGTCTITPTTNIYRTINSAVQVCISTCTYPFMLRSNTINIACNVNVYGQTCSQNTGPLLSWKWDYCISGSFSWFWTVAIYLLSKYSDFYS